jgi:hypothetical protein
LSRVVVADAASELREHIVGLFEFLGGGARQAADRFL